MTPGKDQIVLQASEGFKDALGKYASENKTSMAEVIRKAVAAMIGYDLSLDPPRTRTPKYGSPEEQKAVTLRRALLIRWGNKTSARLLTNGKIDEATIIARAVATRDYDSLEALMAIANGDDEETDETDDE